VADVYSVRLTFSSIANYSVSLVLRDASTIRPLHFSVPIEVHSCPPLYEALEDGTCGCPIGSVLTSSDGAMTCEACEAPTSAFPGSDACNVCARFFFKQNASRTASAANCRPCPTGVHCTHGTTMETLSLKSGYWRASSATSQTWPCKSSGLWSPCAGGIHPSGYCSSGYDGPLCEVCTPGNGSRYFDTDKAICSDCTDVASRAIVGYCVLLSLLIATVGLASVVYWRPGRYRNVLLKAIARFQRLWRLAGMRSKVKILVGFVQVTLA
jgi:hypothetical protein